MVLLYLKPVSLMHDHFFKVSLPLSHAWHSSLFGNLQGIQFCSNILGIINVSIFPILLHFCSFCVCTFLS